MATTDTETGRTRHLGRLLVAGLVGLLLGLSLALYAAVSGAQDRSAIEERYAGELAQAEDQLERQEAAIDRLDSQIALYQGRIALGEALQHLDRRNFGTANEALDEAASSLADVTHEDVAALQADIERADLETGSNLQGQRQQVLDLAGRLDQVIDAAPPGS